MNANKDCCMSSYLEFCYIEKDDMDFCEGMRPKKIDLNHYMDLLSCRISAKKVTA